MSKLQVIKTIINQCAAGIGRLEPIELLAVTKNQSITAIEQLVREGQKVFGENRVQEAYAKWPALKQSFPDLRLHLIGHLQTNKVKEAVALFDVIQTLDGIKLAEKLVAEEKKQNKKLTYYIQINIGREPQKTGVAPENFEDFFTKINDQNLKIEGIMCIPPFERDPTPYFQEMTMLAKDFNLPIISMGMSDDYRLAIECGSNLVRIGRALF